MTFKFLFKKIKFHAIHWWVDKKHNIRYNWVDIFIKNLNEFIFRDRILPLKGKAG